MAITRRRRFRNPRGGSGIAALLPWVAVGGLLYLMAQNAGKVKAAGPGTATGPVITPAGGGSASGVAAGNAACFGVTSPSCWCG